MRVNLGISAQNPNGLELLILVIFRVEMAEEGPGFVGIRFCQECNNMLYPKVNIFYYRTRVVRDRQRD